MSDTPEALSGQVFHKFLTLVHITRQYTHQMTDHGIRPRDFAVLRFILDTGPSTVGDVQRYLFRSASTTSTLLAKLEEEGYLTRTRSSADNRVVVVELTEDGRNVAANTPMVGLPLLRRRLLALSPDQLERIDDSLAELMELMEVEPS